MQSLTNPTQVSASLDLVSGTGDVDTLPPAALVPRVAMTAGVVRFDSNQLDSEYPDPDEDDEHPLDYVRDSANRPFDKSILIKPTVAVAPPVVSSKQRPIAPSSRSTSPRAASANARSRPPSRLRATSAQRSSRPQTTANAPPAARARPSYQRQDASYEGNNRPEKRFNQYFTPLDGKGRSLTPNPVTAPQIARSRTPSAQNYDRSKTPEPVQRGSNFTKYAGRTPVMNKNPRSFLSNAPPNLSRGPDLMVPKSSHSHHTGQVNSSFRSFTNITPPRSLSSYDTRARTYTHTHREREREDW